MHAIPAPPQTHATEPAVDIGILVVDDSAAQRALLVRMLSGWGYAVKAAASATEALAICGHAPPQIVISDWMMPGMDGIAFCRAFRALPSESYGYFILLTSKSEKAEVARGLDAGADDFLSKPVNPEELRARVNAGARIVSMQRELADKTQVISDTLTELQAAYASIDRDLRQARRIQDALVPERARRFGPSQVSLLLRPCGHVGGDLVGFFGTSEDRIGIYALDVSGHGITSAMMTARVAGYLNPRFPDQNIALESRFDRYFAMRHPRDVVGRLNERLVSDPGVDEYLTMIYATLDLTEGRVSLVQAGHPGPVLIRAGLRPEMIGGGGFPVGLVADVAYPALDLRLEPGDRLLFYSDGLTEAMHRDGHMIGDDGLLSLVAKCRRSRGTEFLDELFWRLSEAMGPGAGLDDDVSAALIEYRVYDPP